MSGRLGYAVQERPSVFAGGALDPVSFRGSVDSVGFTALRRYRVVAECSGVLWRGPGRRPHNDVESSATTRL